MNAKSANQQSRSWGGVAERWMDLSPEAVSGCGSLAFLPSSKQIIDLTLLVRSKVVMTKPLVLTFPKKTASQLAERLGVSKTRQKRIFTIVGENGGKSGSGVIWVSGPKPKSRTSKKSVSFSSRPRQRSNAKAAR